MYKNRNNIYFIILSVITILTITFFSKNQYVELISPRRFLVLSHTYIHKEKINFTVFSDLEGSFKIKKLLFKNKKNKIVFELPINKNINGYIYHLEKQVSLPVNFDKIKEVTLLIESPYKFFQKNEFFDMTQTSSHLKEKFSDYKNKYLKLSYTKKFEGIQELKLNIGIIQLLRLEKDIKSIGLRNFRYADELIGYKGSLSIGNISTKVRFGIHGDLNSHWKRERKSFQVKIRKNNNLKHIKNFSIIRAEDKYAEYEIYAQKSSKRLNLFHRKIKMIDFWINSTLYDNYLIYEKSEPDAIATNNFSFSHVISQNNAWKTSINKKDSFIPNAFMNRSIKDNNNSLNLVLFKVRPNHSSGFIIKKFKSFIENTSDKNIDLEDFAKYLSIVALTGSYHSVLVDNLRWGYRPNRNLFSPIYYDTIPRKLKESFNNFLNEIERLSIISKNILNLRPREYWLMKIKKYGQISDQASQNKDLEIINHNNSVINNWSITK